MLTYENIDPCIIPDEKTKYFMLVLNLQKRINYYYVQWHDQFVLFLSIKQKKNRIKIRFIGNLVIIIMYA